MRGARNRRTSNAKVICGLIAQLELCLTDQVPLAEHDNLLLNCVAQLCCPRLEARTERFESAQDFANAPGCRTSWKARKRGFHFGQEIDSATPGVYTARSSFELLLIPHVVGFANAVLQLFQVLQRGVLHRA